MSRISKISVVIIFCCLACAVAASPWSWVWYPGEWQKSPNMYFGRFTFNIDEEVKSAYVFFTGDNFTTLFLNGQNVGGSGDWYTLKPVTIKALKPHLVKGKNVLAARVQNDDYEGGFVLKGMILLANGRQIALHSNEKWLCANKAVEGWEKLDFDDSKWVPSECIGTPPAGSWGAPTMPPSRNLIGAIEIGNPESEKKFSYTGKGELFDARFSYIDRTGFSGKGRIIEKNESFKIRPNAQGYIVLKRTIAENRKNIDLKVSIDGQDAGTWHSASPEFLSAIAGCWDAFFVVPYELTNSKPEITVTLTPEKPGEYVAYRYDIFTTFEWYMFDDSATGSLDREALEAKYKSNPKDPVVAFMYGMALEGERRWQEAKKAYKRCAELLVEGDLAESANRGARLATAMNALSKAGRDAKKLFDIGAYLKLNSFHSEAVEAFRKSLELQPAYETYDQLGEAMLYAGMPIKECIGVWKEGLEKFPPKDTNVWSAIFTLSPSKEQESLVEAQKEQLMIMQDMIYTSSRGRMALDAKYIVNPPPVQELFGEGELDTLITVSGGAGGGSTLGPDVTYGHSGWSGFGFVTPWDVAWHEWIHQFECGLGSSGNGYGWGGCHGSTYYGYRPPWWDWYRAAMRYYVLPGQYRRVCLSDHWNVPYADKWLVKGPFNSPDVAPKWICFPGKRDAANFAWATRKAFQLETMPAKAIISATGDDYSLLYLNGKFVRKHGSWMSAPEDDIAKYLVKGKNVISLAGFNTGYGGAVLAYLTFDFGDRKNHDIASDESWLCSEISVEQFNNLDKEKPAPDWAKIDFNDANWNKSEAVGQYPCGPWNVIQIKLPDRIITTDFVGAQKNAPSGADGWKAVNLPKKVFKLNEIVPSKEDAYQTMTYAFSYVYSPADIRAHMLIGASRRTLISLNGEEVHRHMGNGYPTLPAVFVIHLKKGWNRLLVRAEDINRQSVFYIKIFQPNGKPIEGLKYTNEKPGIDIVPDQKTVPSFDPLKPEYYQWKNIAEDPYPSIPQLTNEDLATYTGYKGLKFIGGNNFFFIDLGISKIPEGYSMLASYAGGEHEVNNALTYDFEPFAVVRCLRNGKPVDLLFIKPDAYELVFDTGLLKIAKDALNPGEKILGWALANNRICIVAETLLPAATGKTMDLMSPE